MGKKSQPPKRPPSYAFRIFLSLVILSVLIIVFNTLFFASQTNIYLHDYTPKYESHPKTSPLEDFFLERYNSQIEGTEEFSAVILPRLNEGNTGEEFVGFINMVLYCIFTKSTFYLPRGLFFKNEEKYPWMKFFQAKQFELQKYIQYPPDDDVLQEKLDNLNSHCFYEDFSGSVDRFEFLQHTYPKDPKNIRYIQEWGEQHKPQDDESDLFRNWRVISDKIGYNLFVSSEGKEKVFHEPKNVKDGFPISCFKADWYGYWMYHVLRSPKKVEFLCDTLKLCDGIDRSLLDDRVEGFIHFGTVLSRNIVSSLFKVKLVDKKLSTYVDLKLKKIIQHKHEFKETHHRVVGMQLETRNTGYEFPRDDDIILDCVLKKFLDSEFRKNKTRGVVIHVASDIPFPQELRKKLRLTLQQERIFRPDHGFKDLEIISNRQILYTDDIEDEIPEMYRIENDPFTEVETKLVKRYFDLLMFSRADSLLLTQFSPYGLFLSSFGKAIVEKHPFYMPYLKGISQFPFACTMKVPYHVCPESKCPLEYNLS